MINYLLKVNKANFILSMFKETSMVTEWYYVNTAYSNNPKSWNVKMIAKSICSFDDILTECEAEVARILESLPQEIQDLKKYRSLQATQK